MSRTGCSSNGRAKKIIIQLVKEADSILTRSFERDGMLLNGFSEWGSGPLWFGRASLSANSSCSSSPGIEGGPLKGGEGNVSGQPFPMERGGRPNRKRTTVSDRLGSELLEHRFRVKERWPLGEARDLSPTKRGKGEDRHRNGEAFTVANLEDSSRGGGKIVCSCQSPSCAL